MPEVTGIPGGGRTHMDGKKKSLLSNVFDKIGGGNEEPDAAGSDAWESLRNDEDMDVLMLDDSVPAAPAQREENPIELTLGEGLPEESSPQPQRPDLSLGGKISAEEPEAGVSEEPAGDAWKPVMQTKPELTLEPELEVKPELTLEPELQPAPDPDAVLSLEPEKPAAEVKKPAGQPKKPAARPEITEDGWEMHYARPEKPAEQPESPAEEMSVEDEFGEEPSGKPKFSWKIPKLPKMPGLSFGRKPAEDGEYAGEEYAVDENPEEPAPEEEDFGAGTPESVRPQEAAAAGTAKPRPPVREEAPEDEDYEFDDEGTGAVRAILGSAGTMAAGIGVGLLGILKVIGRFIRDAFLAAFTAIGAYLQHEFRPKNLRNLFSRYLIAFIIIYYELVLKFSTTGKPLGFSILYMVLFSICWGLVGYLLTTILRPAANRNARRVLILVLAVPYLVNYFRFRQTGAFLGLADTMPVTAKSLLGIIFSLPGIAHIALYLIPFLLYHFVLCYADKAKRIKARRRIRTVGVILLLWFLTWLLVLANGNYRWAYSKEYSYGTAVSDFGLLNTMRLDVLMKLRGNTGRSAGIPAPAAEPLEDESADEWESSEEETEETDDGFVDPLDEQMEDAEPDEDMDEESLEDEEGTDEEDEAPEEDGEQPVV